MWDFQIDTMKFGRSGQQGCFSFFRRAHFYGIDVIVHAVDTLLSEAEQHGYERASKYPKSTKYGRQNPISARWNSDGELFLWREAWADTVGVYTVCRYNK